MDFSSKKPKNKKNLMMMNTGALQEGVRQRRATKSNFKNELKTASMSQMYPTDEFFEQNAAPEMQQQISPAPHMNIVMPSMNRCDPDTGRIDVEIEEPDALSTESSLEPMRYSPMRSLFFYTVPEGQRVLITDKRGRMSIVEGPKRLASWGKRIEMLQHHIAYPGEFLIMRYRDGSQKHLSGPREEWFDPRIHASIEKSDVLQIAAKEAVVVYAKEDESDDKVQRRIVMGPAVFTPNPGEWLHTFRWHGSSGEGYRKVPRALVFQKLWLMPDQMYHDVEDVRTADDVVLTIKLMIFFELVDIDKMLEETHDPIGDFINATSSDVIDLVGRYTFDEFKAHTERLNDNESYSQLHGRATQVGYEIHKIVYRGYSTTAALQAMHEQAIETRTRLKLENETEKQAQELADFKQEREFERDKHARIQEKEQEKHELEKKQLRAKLDLELFQQRSDSKRNEQQKQLEQEMAYRQKQDEQRLQYLDKLRQLGVELTPYLTQSRADKVIELRGGDSVTPHLHLENDEE